jgi:hypothetical protein
MGLEIGQEYPQNGMLPIILCGSHSILRLGFFTSIIPDFWKNASKKKQPSEIRKAVALFVFDTSIVYTILQMPLGSLREGAGSAARRRLREYGDRFDPAMHQYWFVQEIGTAFSLSQLR